MSKQYTILYIRGVEMVKDLLYISKELLNCLINYDFSKEESEYIINVVIKTIDLSIFELENNNFSGRNMISRYKTLD